MKLREWFCAAQLCCLEDLSSVAKLVQIKHERKAWAGAGFTAERSDTRQEFFHSFFLASYKLQHRYAHQAIVQSPLSANQHDGMTQKPPWAPSSVDVQARTILWGRNQPVSSTSYFAFDFQHMHP